MMVLRLIRDEKGATLAVTAVMIGAVLSMLALAIDLGMLRVARVEAQAAADAAALAGAAEFLYVTPAAAAVPTAHDSALSYAKKNVIRNVPIDSAEVTIQVIPAEQKVWVRIERSGLSLWFAKLLGTSIGTVSAAAAAAAMPAGAAQCLAPFAVPDIWAETDTLQDLNRNLVWDTGEPWVFEPVSVGGTDYYLGHQVPTAPSETGYGSDLRNGVGGIYQDYGREMVLKVQDPLNAPVSGFFYPFRIGANTGASDYRDAITNCDTQIVPLNAPVPLEMGNMVGPTRQGVADLIALDPSATWTTGYGITSSNFGNGPNSRSPRIKTVPLYDPNYILQVAGGNHNLTFNNFAQIFIEGIQSQGNVAWVVGRFMYFATGLGGSGSGGAGASLARVLQLVE